MRSSRHSAIELVDAAGRDPRERGEVGPDTARLLDAVGVLVAASPAPAVPDVAFSASLKASLLSRYDELVAAKEKPARGRSAAGRMAWIALPAAAVAVAVVLVLAFFVFKPSGPPAIAELTVQNGFARLITEGGTERVEKSAGVHEDDVVSVPGGSRATITFDNGNITRLEADSELRVDEYGKEFVTVLLEKGKAYNRVIPGTAYSVVCRGVNVRSAGTAFGVDAVSPEIAVPVFESAARVSWTGASPTPVDQGFKAIVTGEEGSYSIQVVPLDLAQLDFSWLAFNRDLDSKLGFPLGVLENLAPTPSEGIVPPGTPASSAPARTSQPAQPSSQPTQPAGQPASSLSLADSGPPVVIAWSASNVGSADTVAILRGDGGAQPSYPANVLDVSQGAGATSYQDGRVVAGRSYTYRVAYLAGGSVLVYSNPVGVTVPAPEPPPPPKLYLGGEPVEKGMYLKWYMEGEGAIDTWAVLASQSNSDPGYPGSVVDRLPYSGPSGSYVFGGASQTARYYFKIAGLSGGRVVVYSNVIRSP